MNSILNEKKRLHQQEILSSRIRNCISNDTYENFTNQKFILKSKNFLRLLDDFSDKTAGDWLELLETEILENLIE